MPSRKKEKKILSFVRSSGLTLSCICCARSTLAMDSFLRMDILRTPDETERRKEKKRDGEVEN